MTIAGKKFGTEPLAERLKDLRMSIQQLEVRQCWLTL